MHPSGFTLIEVLISLLLLSLILLGFDAIGVQTLRELRSGYYFVQAINQIHSMQERLRALGTHEGLNEQMKNWNKENSEVLPQGVGQVFGNYPAYSITIYWGKSQTECPIMLLGINGCLTRSIKL